MVSDTTSPPIPASLHALLTDTRPVGHTVEADTDRVELIADLERVKSSICAYQADLAVDLDHSVKAREAEADEAGRAAGSQRAPQGPGRGVAAQIALARQESPHRGQVLLGFAHDLATDLPCTREALRDGRLNEYRAMLVARETGCLTREDRALIDEDVCGDPEPARRPRHPSPGRRAPPPRRPPSTPPRWPVAPGEPRANATSACAPPPTP